MKRVLFVSALVAVLAAADLTSAQQQPQPGSEVGGKPKMLEGIGGAGAYGPLLSLLAQKSKGQGAPQSGDAAYPMFQLLGPEMRAGFWADPEAAGRALVLEGELMVKMGEILIQHGRALQEQATEKKGK
ncbi:MAG: hypothetical protein KGL31_13215 [candidate division NC10 bacterium]|nr:hypothetical protein [candidate division NC10 bacterium]MDE2322849.1 hypothetical protein [candidate division NC10 bacterium]